MKFIAHTHLRLMVAGRVDSGAENKKRPARNNADRSQLVKKSLAEFAVATANIIQSDFSEDMRLGKITAQAANVRA